MRARRLTAFCIVGGLAMLAVSALVVPGPAFGAATGQVPAEPTTLPELPEGAGRIIPPPGGGRQPVHAGDRGGWQQGLVAVLVAGGVGLVALLAVRDARRSGHHRRADGLAPPDGG